MLEIIVERFRQKHRTVGYPDVRPTLSPRFRGRPVLHAQACAASRPEGWQRALEGCPTGALALENGAPALDMGLCTFCGICSQNAPEGCIVFTGDWRLGATRREDLVLRPGMTEAPPIVPAALAGGAFARSFRLRQVSAAGCGACEADLNVLTTVVFDLGRFGIDFVASPRHADALVVTGPVPRNMQRALLKCHAAAPAPKAVIAVGACAISGGLFRPPAQGAPSANGAGVLPHLKADLFIPGCPPHPYTELDAMLRYLGRPPKV